MLITLLHRPVQKGVRRRKQELGAQRRSIAIRVITRAKLIDVFPISFRGQAVCLLHAEDGHQTFQPALSRKSKEMVGVGQSPLLIQVLGVFVVALVGVVKIGWGHVKAPCRRVRMASKTGVVIFHGWGLS